jgi:hypothetical protein
MRTEQVGDICEREKGRRGDGENGRTGEGELEKGDAAVVLEYAGTVQEFLDALVRGDR